jgi:hypothetical protein
MKNPALKKSNAPIVFVCHSFGGLVVKKLVMKARAGRDLNEVKGAFLDRIAGVVFLATPHDGSALATLANIFGWTVTDTIRDLIANSSKLGNLSDDYRDAVDADGKRIRHLIYYEKEGVASIAGSFVGRVAGGVAGDLVVKALRPFAPKVVSTGSANPGLAGADRVPIARDHINICKIATRIDQVYEGVVDFLENVLKERSPSMREIAEETKDDTTAILEHVDYLTRKLRPTTTQNEALATDLAKAKADLDAPETPTNIDLGILRTCRRATQAFCDDYLVSEIGEMPFGGRDSELARLDAWLTSPKAAPRMLITGPAGRGKSALLVRWMKSIQERSHIPEYGWEFAFMPISIRVGTNRSEIYWAGLASRLAEITHASIELDSRRDAESFKGIVADQLNAIAEIKQRAIVVIDGLDEALQGSFDPSVLPRLLPPNLRVLLSARWQLGDVDSTGWLNRLEWERSVCVEKFELDPFTIEKIADVLIKLGAPTDVMAQEPELVARRHTLTQGEPLLVRYYAEDLSKTGHERPRITKADLNDLKPGFEAYFERWLSQLEKQWVDENIHINRKEVDQVLSILAYALGPIESKDFVALMQSVHDTKKFLIEREIMKPLRRFIIGNGKPNSGYVLSHSKIGEYLLGERFAAHVDFLSNGFVGWGQANVRALNSGRKAPADASRYALQFLSAHFSKVNLSINEWMELVEDGWRKAWEHFEGVPRGFARDVQTAWTAVRSQSALSTTIGVQWRCALALSSIRSVGINIPDTLLCAAVSHGRLSIRQAIHFSEISRSDVDLFQQLFQLTNLSPSQSSVLNSTLFMVAQMIGDRKSRAEALSSLAPHLSGEQKAAALADALSSAMAIGAEKPRAEALTSLAPHLSGEQRTTVLAAALAAAETIGGEPSRVRALASLAPYLSGEQRATVLTDALKSAMAIGAEKSRAEALASLAPYLSAEQVSDALVSAMAIGDGKSRAEALASLAPYLSTKQVADALVSAMAIGDGKSRTEALASLAPYLSAEQVADALVSAMAIGDGKSRAEALTSLARTG